MIVEVVDALLKMVGDRVGGFEIGIVQRSLLQHEKPRLDEVEPRGIRGSPEKLDGLGCSGPEIQRPFVGAEVVPDDVDVAVRSESRHHRFLQKREHNLPGFVGAGNSHGLAGMRSKGRQELNGLGGMIAARRRCGFLPQDLPPRGMQASGPISSTHTTTPSFGGVRYRLTILFFLPRNPDRDSRTRSALRRNEILLDGAVAGWSIA